MQNKFINYEVRGDKRQERLTRIKAQMNSWGLALPAEEPLLLHFGLGKFESIGETEFWISNEIGAGYCAKYMFVFKDQSCPMHFHKLKHETFFMVKGTCRVSLDGETAILKEGDRLVIVPGTKHEFTGISNCLILEASMPSIPGDSYFEEKGIGSLGVL